MQKKLFSKFICVVLTLCLALSMVAVVGAEGETPITVYVNGEQVEFDVQPATINDRTMVPMRFIFEKLGATVDYDDPTKTITAKTADKTVTLQLDNQKAVVEMGGEAYEMISDVAPVLVDDRTLVPVRFISEALEHYVGWNESKKQVNIIDFAPLAAKLEQAAPKYVNEFLNQNITLCKGTYELSLSTSDSEEALVSTVVADGKAMSIKTGDKEVILTPDAAYISGASLSPAILTIVSPAGNDVWIKVNPVAALRAQKALDADTSAIQTRAQLVNALLTPELAKMEAETGIDNQTYAMLSELADIFGLVLADENIVVSGNDTIYEMNEELAAQSGVSISSKKTVDAGVLTQTTTSLTSADGEQVVTVTRSMTRTGDAPEVVVPAESISYAMLSGLIDTIR